VFTGQIDAFQIENLDTAAPDQRGTTDKVSISHGSTVSEGATDLKYRIKENTLPFRPTAALFFVHAFPARRASHETIPALAFQGYFR
jgi:hypothetical protein